MGEVIDLTGKKFGKLTVISRVKNRGRYVYWHCKCDCGNEKEICGSSLKRGHTTSCGCIRTTHSTNEYEFTADICIGYTNKNEMFLIDIEDFDKIKNYCWHFDSQGYVATNTTVCGKAKKIRLHRLIMNFPDGMVDHKHGSDTKYDNRKSNLRVCNNTLNQRNKKVKTNSKTGVKGVSFTHCNTYQAQIQVDGKLIYLGSYKSIKEASDAYDKAAIKYFGDFAALNNYAESTD